MIKEVYCIIYVYVLRYGVRKMLLYDLLTEMLENMQFYSHFVPAATLALNRI